MASSTTRGATDGREASLSACALSSVGVVVAVGEEEEGEDDVVMGIGTLSFRPVFPSFLSPAAGAGGTSIASCEMDKEKTLSSSSRALEAAEEEMERVPPGRKGG
jgi:hypothetical protein